MAATIAVGGGIVAGAVARRAALFERAVCCASFFFGASSLFVGASGGVAPLPTAASVLRLFVAAEARRRLGLAVFSLAVFFGSIVSGASGASGALVALVAASVVVARRALRLAAFVNNCTTFMVFAFVDGPEDWVIPVEVVIPARVRQ